MHQYVAKICTNIVAECVGLSELVLFCANFTLLSIKIQHETTKITNISAKDILLSHIESDELSLRVLFLLILVFG